MCSVSSATMAFASACFAEALQQDKRHSIPKTIFLSFNTRKVWVEMAYIFRNEAYSLLRNDKLKCLSRHWEQVVASSISVRGTVGRQGKSGHLEQSLNTASWQSCCLECTFWFQCWHRSYWAQITPLGRPPCLSLLLVTDKGNINSLIIWDFPWEHFRSVVAFLQAD